MGCMFETAKTNQCNEITPKDKLPTPTATATARTTNATASISLSPSPTPPPASNQQSTTRRRTFDTDTNTNLNATDHKQIVDNSIELQIQPFSKYFPSSSPPPTLLSTTSSSSSITPIPAARTYYSSVLSNKNENYRQSHYHHRYVEAVTTKPIQPATMSAKCCMDEYIRAGYYITSRLFNNVDNINNSNSNNNNRQNSSSRRRSSHRKTSNSLLNSRNINYLNNNHTNSSNAYSNSTTTATATATATPSIRNSISLYAASSVILVLCYLTSSTSAAAIDHPIFDESSSDKEILDHLLQKSRYDKRLLPPVNGTLTVNVNVLLLSLASPDESSLKYEVEFLLNQQWNDPRLQYGNKSQYDYLNALHHHDNIWTPDTYFIMHGDFKDPIIPMHFALRIYRNGTITYAMRRHLILSCQGSLHIFPFDDPKCSFSMESISYELSHIKYVWKNDEDTLRKSPSLTTLNAYLIQNATVTCSVKSWRGNYSCLKVELMFTRDRAFYFTTVFIPGIILVTSSFITFWLEWNAVPARVMIGVTTMLNFFTTSNGFRSTLPVVSNLTAMNVWDGVCMCFIYASLLEFVCVNYVGRKRPLHNVVYRPGENPVTQRLPAVLSRIGVILASPLEIIEREFHAALSSEKAAAGVASTPPQSPSPPPPSSHIRPTAPAMHFPTSLSQTHNLSAINTIAVRREPVYAEAIELYSSPTTRQSRSMATNTPPLVVGGRSVSPSARRRTVSAVESAVNVEMTESTQLPVKPPRRKSSRSVTPTGSGSGVCGGGAHDVEASAGRINMTDNLGEKKRETGGPNEIVACTNCGGGSSPCTHSANNGCATETCFVQVRKKEPPHPIRVAKTIDVIARITFPTAYAIFLIFFFVHYKGFS